MMFKTEKLQVKIDLIDKILKYHENQPLNIDNAVDLLVNLKARYESDLLKLEKVYKSIEDSEN